MPGVILPIGGGSLNFSTDEQIVGKWINGKPIYQKTIDCGTLPNATDKNVAHNISNLGTVIAYFGATTNGNDRLLLPISYYTSSNTNWSVQVLISALDVYIVTKSNMTSFNNSYVTILYTKTTD